MKTWIMMAALWFLCSGCEKDVDFALNQAPDLLVVDASIENGQAPMVVLTKSLNFFSAISPVLLANTFVRNAEVTISNGLTTHRLKEYAVPVTPEISLYYYSTDSANLSTAITGAFNTTYTLNIISQGKTYQATTTIPVLAKRPDSLWWKTAPFQEDDTSKVVLMTRTTDPPGFGNYVRYFTRTNRGTFLPGENSTFDDQFIDGTTYDVQVDPGIDRNNRIPLDSNYFRRGDTVTLKLCNIDRGTYQFWNTWEFAQQSIGNPFSQPNKVLGNVSNGALGAFYGYAAFYKTIIIPK